MPRPSTTTSLFKLMRALRGANRRGEPSVNERLASLPRLMQATLSGQYSGASKGRLAGLGAAVLYVMSPVDLVPEAILPFIGLADDAMVLSWIVGTLVTETDAFLRWERTAGPAAAAAPGGVPGAAPKPQADTGGTRPPASEDVVPGRVVP